MRRLVIGGRRIIDSYLQRYAVDKKVDRKNGSSGYRDEPSPEPAEEGVEGPGSAETREMQATRFLQPLWPGKENDPALKEKYDKWMEKPEIKSVTKALDDIEARLNAIPSERVDIRNIQQCAKLMDEVGQLRCQIQQIKSELDQIARDIRVEVSVCSNEKLITKMLGMAVRIENVV